MQTIYDFTVNDISGNDFPLNQLKDKVVLIVNVASKCGFTPQYTELEDIYQQYKNLGLVVLAFPCNQFGEQEPGNAEEIKNFCSLNYNVEFPIMDKVDVNGPNTVALYEFLKNSLPGLLGSKSIKWNFTKFLIDRNGIPRTRYAPTDKPMSIVKDIKALF